MKKKMRNTIKEICLRTKDIRTGKYKNKENTNKK